MNMNSNMIKHKCIDNEHCNAVGHRLCALLIIEVRNKALFIYEIT